MVNAGEGDIESELERLRARIDDLETELETERSESNDAEVTRRKALALGGGSLLGLAGGARSASAQSSGGIGTADRPVDVYGETVNVADVIEIEELDGYDGNRVSVGDPHSDTELFHLDRADESIVWADADTWMRDGTINDLGAIDNSSLTGSERLESLVDGNLYIDGAGALNATQSGGGDGAYHGGTTSYVVWNDGSQLRGEGRGPSVTGDSLPAVVSECFEHASSVTVASGTYTYGDDLYVPSHSHVHFENVELRPVDGAVGILLGDGEASRTSQRVTGTGTVRPDSGSSPAEACLKLDGVKLAMIDLRMRLLDGADAGSVVVDGGPGGNWWNSIAGLDVWGETHVYTTSSVAVNGQLFTRCLFRGNVYNLPGEQKGNSLHMLNCWFEGIDDLRLAAWTTTLSGRFEGVTINIDDPYDKHIFAHHQGNVDINLNYDGAGGVFSNVDTIFKGHIVLPRRWRWCSHVLTPNSSYFDGTA